jgi:hypothetical protein
VPPVQARQELVEQTTAEDFSVVRQGDKQKMTHRLQERLLLAECQPGQKELMIRLIEHFVLLKDETRP